MTRAVEASSARAVPDEEDGDEHQHRAEQRPASVAPAHRDPSRPIGPQIERTKSPGDTTAGVTYYVRAGGFGGDTGTLVLSIE